MSQTDCFHCGQAVVQASRYTCVLDGQSQPMCCLGCETVAQTIIDQGLADYYRHRSLSQASSPILPTALDLSASHQNQWQAYDDADVQSTFVRQSQTKDHTTNAKEADLVIEGLTCAACIWLLHQQVRKLNGVIHFNVNLTTQRAYLQWHSDAVNLSQIMAAIAAVGYQPSPYQATIAATKTAKDKRQTIMRLGISGLATMQVMMLSFGLYAGQSQDMSEQQMVFFRWLALGLTTPVVFYAALPFFKAAYRALKNRHLVMDVPVSLAIGGAYLASLWATVNNTGEVYFDSVCMFTFLLLFGRFVEAQARYHAGHSGNQLHQLLPPMCCLVTGHQSPQEALQQIAVLKLKTNDTVRVKPGETIPADGVIVCGTTSINEAALSGEFLPVNKQLGDQVTAGTINVASSIDIQVTQVDNSRLQQIVSLVQQAHSFRPKMSYKADRVAHYFVLAVLSVSACVYGTWYFIDPDKAFWITLSVLVITCPCALSLAAPTATAVATASLRKQGILMTREDALEEIAKIDTIVFDKTGTLTTGAMALQQTISLGPLNDAQCLSLVSQLESQSEHPIARAFSQLDIITYDKLRVSNFRNHTSQGVSGQYSANNQLVELRFGQRQFAAAHLTEQPQAPDEQGLWLLLADAHQALAWFKINDAPRKGLCHTISQLKQHGYELHLLSGDQANNVSELARNHGISHWHACQTPQQKLDFITHLQQQGQRVLMVGDGVNDAPVMAAADAAVAMASGTDLSKSSAPALLLRDNLNLIQVLLRKAQQTHTIMQQNLSWALLYNVIALPLAAAGLIPPWGAAIGMSTSSLLVVLNATRLKAAAQVSQQ